MIDIRVFETPEEIAAEAALLAAETLKQALSTQDLATFVLAGGRLPPIASQIISQEHETAFDWSRILFLIGDERIVPLDDPQSSWLGALPMLDAHSEIPPQHKLRPQSQLSAETASKEYAKTLLSLPLRQNGLPALDLVWLGIGEDGHTLSLFPGNSSFTQETDQLVIPVHDSPKPPPDRISFSLHALKGVKSAIVFISGSSKAPIVAQIAQGDHSLPIVVASQTIERAGGHVTWLIDRDAMALIPSGQSLHV